MAEAKFIYEGKDIVLSCSKNQKMRDICIELSNKISVGINSLIFLNGESLLNLEKTFEESTKENKISIIVFKYENKEILCQKCGWILKNEIFDEIISSNNKMNHSLIDIKRLIESIMTDINNNVDTDYIISQLQNINVLINNISEYIIKINNKLNMNQSNYIRILNQNNNNNKKEEERFKNKISCIYNKQEDEIDLLHDYTIHTDKWKDEEKKSYSEGKKNINEKNIDIYINDKQIKFNYKYKSNEKGNIKVEFIFNKLLTSTNYMFYGCSSLQSINLSSFNTTNVNNMSGMFCYCSSLQSIDLSLFNTTNVNNMSGMFSRCTSLKSLNLSSFNTNNVNDMNSMFYGCSSLQSINLSSFNTTNVKDISFMFLGCSSLKKENIKIGSYGKKILAD